ncbi:MAG: glycosyltransferase [Candidatus Omnitrophota bacterium]
MQLLIVGGRGGTNIGDSFFRAAEKIGLNPFLINIQDAFKSTRLVRYINWYLMGKRPPKIGCFSSRVVEKCAGNRPKWLLVTGMAPVDKDALREAGKLNILRINYLTDDPWNRAHFSSWFLKALPYYDIVYSTRKANLPDLSDAGCKRAEYLPFGYDHELFYPETLTEEENEKYSSDIIFVGGADRDRIKYIDAIIKTGLRLALYGSYWERYAQARDHTLGQAGFQEVRKATRAAKVALCLVRKANRDGHSMRSFEIPATGTCMLTEDTQEHRLFFGEEGKSVIYFSDPAEMAEKLRWLTRHESERRRLAEASRRLIVNGSNTYADRLNLILGV